MKNWQNTQWAYNKHSIKKNFAIHALPTERQFANFKKNIIAFKLTHLATCYQPWSCKCMSGTVRPVLSEKSDFMSWSWLIRQCICIYFLSPATQYLVVFARSWFWVIQNIRTNLCQASLRCNLFWLVNMHKCVAGKSALNLPARVLAVNYLQAPI